MRISVNREKCCGFGTCTLIAPEVFDMRAEDNLAYPLLEEAGPEHKDAVQEAVAQCPAEAIVVTD